MWIRRTFPLSTQITLPLTSEKLRGFRFYLKGNVRHAGGGPEAPLTALARRAVKITRKPTSSRSAATQGGKPAVKPRREQNSPAMVTRAGGRKKRPPSEIDAGEAAAPRRKQPRREAAVRGRKVVQRALTGAAGFEPEWQAEDCWETIWQPEHGLQPSCRGSRHHVDLRVLMV